MRVLINRVSSGFHLSDEAIEKCIELGMSVTEFDTSRMSGMSVAEFDGGRMYKNPDAVFVEHKKRPYGGQKYDIINRFDEQTKNNEESKRCKEMRINATVHEVVDSLGVEKSSRRSDELKYVNIPFNGINGWRASSNGSGEFIEENHRTWS